MAHDVIIRNGTLIDGTGAAGKRADLAIDGERIAAIGKIDGNAPLEIDATGKLVTPGFVDIHTHLDAQLAWDPIASSSCYHGVTSVVLGNCGVTFAPCKPEDRDYLAKLMESVEDIPAASILNGLPWDWVTYGEYLASLSRLKTGVNVGGMVGHCAVRYHAMGERGLDDVPASADDITRMCALVDEAIGAGALGFSTSRTFMHRVPDGRPVPGTYARADELLAIGRVLGKHKRGVFEAAARLGERDNAALDNTRREVELLAEISRENRIAVTFGLTESARRPDLYRRVIDVCERENARGANLRPQTTSRGIGALFGIHNRTPYDRFPAWQNLRGKSLDEKLAILRRDRAALIASVDDSPGTISPEQLFVLLPNDVAYHNDPERSLAAHARRRNEGAVAAFIDLALETDGRASCYYAALNQNLDAVKEMILNPTVAMGLADSGAHVGQIMDASQPSWLLAHWVRDRKIISVEEAIRRWTSDTAAIFGIKDRGTLREGACADVNVIDLDALALEAPEYVHDFPGGAGRYVQRARGYAATLVNGRVFMSGGQPTGELRGRMLRAA